MKKYTFEEIQEQVSKTLNPAIKITTEKKDNVNIADIELYIQGLQNLITSLKNVADEVLKDIEKMNYIDDIKAKAPEYKEKLQQYKQSLINSTANSSQNDSYKNNTSSSLSEKTPHSQSAASSSPMSFSSSSSGVNKAMPAKEQTQHYSNNTSSSLSEKTPPNKDTASQNAVSASTNSANSAYTGKSTVDISGDDTTKSEEQEQQEQQEQQKQKEQKEQEQLKVQARRKGI